MKFSLIMLIFALLIGCSKNDSLALMMEVGFSEQFSNACNGDTECIRAVESFLDICFNKNLAIAAIDATAADKKRVNTQHILEIQKCISQKAGKDYWKETNMPGYILDQVN